MRDPAALLDKAAPSFRLPPSAGKVIGPADFKGKQTVVLYFYPRADTPGCTKEACGFRDALEDYDKARVAVLGISPDPVEDVTKFSDKFHLNFPLLADADHSVAEKYAVWQEKSMYGKKYWGVARTTFVIGKDGKVKHVFAKVKPEGRERFLKAIEVDALGSERDERDCFRFNVLQDQQDRNVYYFYEVYRDEAALEAHRAAPHYAVWRAAADTLDGAPQATRCDTVFPAATDYWERKSARA